MAKASNKGKGAAPAPAPVVSAAAPETPTPAAAAPAPAAPAVPAREKQNGIARPLAGSLTGKLWDIADQVSSEMKVPAPRKAVIDRYLKEVPGANLATANTQYARWVVYWGVADKLKAGREAARAAEAETKAQAKATKDAERTAAKEAKAKEAADKKAAAEADRAAKLEAAKAASVQNQAAAT
jgi:hypothetical protein